MFTPIFYMGLEALFSIASALHFYCWPSTFSCPCMSLVIAGRQIDGVWHTGIVVYGEEFFYGGGGGIQSCSPVCFFHQSISTCEIK